jgi:hypothetical protein
MIALGLWRLMNRKHLIALACAVGVMAIAIPAAFAGGAPKTVCHGLSTTPAPGSTVKGGLEVDGICVLNKVTVNGGILVDTTGRLGFDDSTANGGIVVNTGGELDINHVVSGQNPAGTSSTVNGGITLTKPFDFDIWGTQVNGGVQVNGLATGAAPSICGSDISGGVSVSNAVSNGVFIGDPEDNPTFSSIKCPGNAIHGGVSFTNVNSGAIEGNTITGPVTLDASTLEFNGNTITGPSTCTNGTVIVAGEAPDPASNTCS